MSNKIDQKEEVSFTLGAPLGSIMHPCSITGHNYQLIGQEVSLEGVPIKPNDTRYMTAVTPDTKKITTYLFVCTKCGHVFSHVHAVEIKR